MATTITRLTFEEFERLPEQPGKQELLEGEIIELPPAKRKHNVIAHRIYRRLAQIIEDMGSTQLGDAFHEMGYRFGNDGWLQPDVSITYKDQKGEDYFLGAPALAVEVISDSNTPRQIDRKVAIYLAGGALEVWVVYPVQRHIWICRPAGTAEVHESAFQSDLLGGATIDVANLLGD